jgi:hypothetical protein
MLTIKNTKVYNLPDAIIVSGYPTRFGEPEDRNNLTLDDVKIPNRVYSLGSAKQGSGPYHDFIKGFGFKPYKKVFKISIKTIRFYKERIYHLTTEKILFKKIVKEYTEKEYWELKGECKYVDN